MALFTEAEARAFKVGGEATAPLASTTAYPTATITEAHDRIKERFEEICGVAFEPTTTTSLVSGLGTSKFLLPHRRVTAITALSVGGVAFTAGELTQLAVHPFGLVDRSTYGTFIEGSRNVSVTYTHGYTAVPKPIKWAALVVCVKELTDGDLIGRFISRSDDVGTTQLAVPGGWGRWYGLPAVDSILAQYAETQSVAVG